MILSSLIAFASICATVTGAADVENGLVAYIFNNKEWHSRIAAWGSGQSDYALYNGSANDSKDQLWTLKASRVQGVYYIENFVHGCRLGINHSLYCYKDGQYDDQMWYFKPVSGGYLIENYTSHLKNCRIHSRGATDMWYHCDSKVHADQKWRLELPFTVTAKWEKTVDKVNTWDLPKPEDTRVVTGLKIENETTLIKQSSTSVSFGASAKAPMKGVKVSVNGSYGHTSSSYESYYNRMVSTKIVETILKLDIPPKTRICKKQLMLTIYDKTTKSTSTSYDALEWWDQNADCEKIEPAGTYHSAQALPTASETCSGNVWRCCDYNWKWNMVPHVTWGSTPASEQQWYKDNDCNNVMGGKTVSTCTECNAIRTKCCGYNTKWDMVPHVNWGSTPASEQQWYKDHDCNNAMGGKTVSRCTGTSSV